MAKLIVFNLPDAGVCVMHPADSDLSVLDTGKKDVPAGVNFWIVDSSELPADVAQEVWELDVDNISEPDGIGGTYIALTDAANKGPTDDQN